MRFRLDFTLSHCKGQGQGHGQGQAKDYIHFDCEYYLANGDR